MKAITPYLTFTGQKNQLYIERPYFHEAGQRILEGVPNSFTSLFLQFTPSNGSSKLIDIPKNKFAIGSRCCERCNLA